ncbi:MAG: prolipoprotein diacylglyceryl transferase [candidate division Zixibacteria bacterium]|nr:prolipoprotein diacylglyceryl transferase [candidate division Zixibacteria bacterium]
MQPELFYIGSFPIRAFGLMLALTFLFGVWYVQRVAAKTGKSPDYYLTITYIFIFGGIVGARLGYVVLHWSEFSNNLGAIFNPFHSDPGGGFGIAGLNLYGGVLLAILSAYTYCKIKKQAVLEVFDIFSPTLAMGIGITRIGCFLNGCCFGTPTGLPWGVQFPDHSIPWMIFRDQHLHPAQIYSSAYGFLLFFVLHQLLKRRQFAGQVVAVLFMAEALFRFLIEFVRYYEEEMIFSIGGIEPTWNQVVSLALFLLGLGIYISQRRIKAVISQ